MPIVSDEDAASFLRDQPTPAFIGRLTVSELRSIARHFGATYIGRLVKADLINLVHQQLGWNEGLDDPCLSESDEGEVNREPEANPEFRQVELQIKLEETRNRSIETQLRLAELGVSRDNNIFYHEKTVRLIPAFNEAGVDAYFSSFERLATRLSWLRDQWIFVLQQSFKGKALKAYMTPSDVEACSYDKVKKQVLQAYSLVPEAYRHKFGRLRKNAEQSHLEVARAKREAFISWCRSEEVELILVEAFTLGVDWDVASYLALKRVKTAEEAATVADNYL